MLVVEPDSAEPPFAQVCRQLTDQICEGVIAPGDRLPTVRRLAGDLGIAPNTVARAYRELEVAGLIEARGRAGTFVVERRPGNSATAQAPMAGCDPKVSAAARRAAESYARRVRDLGLLPADALALAAASLRDETQ